jgi:hypothetical protein
VATANVMLIRAQKRREVVPALQQVLTEFGCLIMTRLGLHEAGDTCSDEGLIILHLIDDADEIKRFEDALSKLDGIKYKVVRI